MGVGCYELQACRLLDRSDPDHGNEASATCTPGERQEGPDMAQTDVVIVGGGIGGGSLAYALATAGLGVTVLEQSVEYPDRVRGESMHLWGVKEARELGVESVLLGAGAHIAPVWKQYVEGIGE